MACTKRQRGTVNDPTQIATEACCNSIFIALLCGSIASASGQATQIGGTWTALGNWTTSAVTISQLQGGCSGAGCQLGGVCQRAANSFPVVEATISSVHAAFLAGNLSCTQLVQAYVQRIEGYDQLSGVNSIRVVNPKLSEQAAAKDDELQKIRSEGGSLPKLFCVPVLVKDNYDTLDMSATAGTAGLLDNFPAQDAHQISLLKSSGAIILAKTNMAEWAFSPEISIGSVFGVIRNPYDLDRSTGGSSGGTAAGLAANLGLAGMGTDTGNSIRGPAGWNALVGIRPSLGLSSRSGVVPLDSTSDVAGPMARTVDDCVRLLEVTVGVDPTDNLTSLQLSEDVPSNYTQFLDADGLQGMRIGVMRQTIDLETGDPDVLALFEQALLNLTAAGATLVKNFTIQGNTLGSLDWQGDAVWYTGYGDSAKGEQLDCGARFKPDINAYLGSSGSRFKTVQEVAGAGLIHPSSNQSMSVRLGIPYLPSEYPTPALAAQGYRCNCAEFYDNPCRVEFRKRLVESMDGADVSVLVFPTWSNRPGLVGDYGSPSGNNSPQISPPTGSPAMVVPMGFTTSPTSQTLLPASLQFLARPFDEGTLITAAYAYEQATKKRRSPAVFPECIAASAQGPRAALSPFGAAFGAAPPTLGLSSLVG